MNVFEPRNELHWLVRVWLDEPMPLVRLDPGGQPLALVVPASEGAVVQKRQAVIEVLQRRGPRFLYGLLGADYAQVPGDELVLLGPTGPEDTGGRYLESLAGAFDTVKVGAPSAYVEAAMSALRELQAKDRLLPAGRLTLSYLAHGEVGSTPLVFQMLARGLARLLVSNNGPTVAQEVAALLD